MEAAAIATILRAATIDQRHRRPINNLNRHRCCHIIANIDITRQRIITAVTARPHLRRVRQARSANQDPQQTVQRYCPPKTHRQPKVAAVFKTPTTTWNR